jgi:hypothetical protein
MKIYNFLIAKPARFFFLAAILWGGLMCAFNSKDGANFQWHDILVEANGMFFDLLVFGVLLSIYEALREKKEKNRAAARRNCLLPRLGRKRSHV